MIVLTPRTRRDAGRNPHMAANKPISAKSTVGAWLKHPVGGPLLRRMLAEAGTDAKVLNPVKLLPLQNLVAMSGGKMQQSVVDDLVAKANSTDPAVIEAALAGAPVETEAAPEAAAASADEDDDFEPEIWEEVVTP